SPVEAATDPKTGKINPQSVADSIQNDIKATAEAIAESKMTGKSAMPDKSTAESRSIEINDIRPNVADDAPLHISMDNLQGQYRPDSFEMAKDVENKISSEIQSEYAEILEKTQKDIDDHNAKSLHRRILEDNPLVTAPESMRPEMIQEIIRE
ncbi:hypothetical protein MHBO_005150, partial [Bonamia ostreae]